MTTGVPLDQEYFAWLCRHFIRVSNRNVRTSFYEMAKALFRTEFVYFVPNDDNRAVDGQDLRYEFLDAYPDLKAEKDWLQLPCSFLEMLVALAKRADFETDRFAMADGVAGWMWEMITNAGLERFTDQVIKREGLEEIHEILDRINQRTYKSNGEGGLFPLKKPRRNQKKVELWYQLSSYLMENKFVKV